MVRRAEGGGGIKEARRWVRERQREGGWVREGEDV